MTYQDFKELWVEFEKSKPNCSLPDYQDYLESENMFEDYLDIFRGENTRSKRSNGLTEWYYEHPFFDGEKPKLENKPCIKYVMIGEARPKSNPVKVNSCGADENNTYFYNTKHVGDTLWLSQPFKVLCPTGWVKPKCKQNKVEILLQLAMAGYVLIDLFPFAIKFTGKIRGQLNERGVTSHFFDHHLTPKLNQIARIQNQCQGEKQEPRIAFSGPATTHHFLIHEIIHGRLNLPNGYAMFRQANYFGTAATPIPVALPGQRIPWITITDLLNGRYANAKSSVKTAPFYRAGCWDGSGLPNSLFIRNAFDLP